MPEETRTVKADVQISASGPARWGGKIFEEFLPELRFPQAVRVYDEMRKNSPVIGGLLRAIEAGFRSTRWQAQPAGSDPEDIRRADFLDSCLHDMQRPWPDTQADILTFLPFGFAATEMVFKYRRGRHGNPTSMYNDGKVGIKDLVLIPQGSILEWMYDLEGDPNKLLGIKQQVTMPFTPGIYREIPIEKVCLFRIRAEKDNPEGESILRQAYQSYYYMTNLQAVEAISLERTGSGIPVVHLPQGATTEKDDPVDSDEARAKELVRQVRIDEQGGIVEPDGWAFRLETSKGLRPELFDLAIKRHRANMLMSVLAVFLELGTARVGSNAMLRGGKSFFSYAFEGWVMAVEDVFNTQCVPLLFELNGITDGRLPKLGHTATGGEDIADVIDSVVRLAQAGFIDSNDETLRDHLQGLLRLPKGNSLEEADVEEDEEDEEVEDEDEDGLGLYPDDPEAGEEVPDVSRVGANGTGRAAAR